MASAEVTPQLFAESEANLVAFGRRLARLISQHDRGAIILLEGELGAGKTTLARGYLRCLGHRGAVKSPTFTLVESYEILGKTIHHIDLYRLSGSEDLEFIGFEDYFSATADLLIEWPDKVPWLADLADVLVSLSYHNGGRNVRISFPNDRWDDQEKINLISNLEHDPK